MSMMIGYMLGFAMTPWLMMAYVRVGLFFAKRSKDRCPYTEDPFGRSRCIKKTGHWIHGDPDHRWVRG